MCVCVCTPPSHQDCTYLRLKMMIPMSPQTTKVKNHMLEILFRIKPELFLPCLAFTHFLQLTVPTLNPPPTSALSHQHHQRAIADILTALYRCQEGLYQPTSHCCEIIYHSKLTVKLHFISPRRQTLHPPPVFSFSLSLPPHPLSLCCSASWKVME